MLIRSTNVLLVQAFEQSLTDVEFEGGANSAVGVVSEHRTQRGLSKSHRLRCGGQDIPKSSKIYISPHMAQACQMGHLFWAQVLVSDVNI